MEKIAKLEEENAELQSLVGKIESLRVESCDLKDKKFADLNAQLTEERRFNLEWAEQMKKANADLESQIAWWTEEGKKRIIEMTPLIRPKIWQKAYWRPFKCWRPFK